MAKVRTNAVAPEPAAATTTCTATTIRGRTAAADDQEPAVSLTVWRKSLLFNCDGFTVFDARGDLAFRADCYDAAPARRRAEVVLMDAAGTPLLTVRRRARLRGLLAPDRWVIYDGDGTSSSRPLLSVRRAARASSTSSSSKSSKALLAHVTPLAADAESAAAFVVEGSYGRRGRACAVRDARGGAVVAEVRRKADVGDDVFRLVVAAGARLGAPLAMGLVVALDEMFAPARSPPAWSLRRAWSSA